jgi:hypothetical protein
MKATVMRACISPLKRKREKNMAPAYYIEREESAHITTTTTSLYVVLSVQLYTHIYKAAAV